MSTFYLLIVIKICSSLVCSLIHDALFLSLHIIRNIIFVIHLWALRSFHSSAFVRLQVSDPYVWTDKMHWLYIFLFSDSGRLLFITLCCLPKALYPNPILFFIYFFSGSGNAPIFCPITSSSILFSILVFFQIHLQNHFLAFSVQLQNHLLFFICRFTH